jgi:hypothetical protein
LDKLDLTNAQKRDERFYPPGCGDCVQSKGAGSRSRAKRGKLGGIVKSAFLVEVDGRFVTVPNKVLDKITVCLPREIPSRKMTGCI